MHGHYGRGAWKAVPEELGKVRVARVTKLVAPNVDPFLCAPPYAVLREISDLRHRPPKCPTVSAFSVSVGS